TFHQPRLLHLGRHLADEVLDQAVHLLGVGGLAGARPEELALLEAVDLGLDGDDVVRAEGAGVVDPAPGDGPVAARRHPRGGTAVVVGTRAAPRLLALDPPHGDDARGPGRGQPRLGLLDVADLGPRDDRIAGHTLRSAPGQLARERVLRAAPDRLLGAHE